MKKCCNNCKHLVYEKDTCLNSFPYCIKYEVVPEPKLMNEPFDWCDDFKPREDKKEEFIVHWMDIVAAVITAENNISEKWQPILKAAKGKSDIEVEQTADQYIRAIATEIIDNTNWKMEE